MVAGLEVIAALLFLRWFHRRGVAYTRTVEWRPLANVRPLPGIIGGGVSLLRRSCDKKKENTTKKKKKKNGAKTNNDDDGDEDTDDDAVGDETGDGRRWSSSSSSSSSISSSSSSSKADRRLWARDEKLRDDWFVSFSDVARLSKSRLRLSVPKAAALFARLDPNDEGVISQADWCRQFPEWPRCLPFEAAGPVEALLAMAASPKMETGKYYPLPDPPPTKNKTTKQKKSSKEKTTKSEKAAAADEVPQLGSADDDDEVDEENADDEENEAEEEDEDEEEEDEEDASLTKLFASHFDKFHPSQGLFYVANFARQALVAFALNALSKSNGVGYNYEEDDDGGDSGSDAITRRHLSEANNNNNGGGGGGGGGGGDDDAAAYDDDWSTSLLVPPAVAPLLQASVLLGLELAAFVAVARRCPYVYLAQSRSELVGAAARAATFAVAAVAALPSATVAQIEGVDVPVIGTIHVPDPRFAANLSEF